MAHVLIVTVGPAQELIAAARRCRDLWFGSWLLSELCKAVARSLVTDCGIEALIFPGIDSAAELAPASATNVTNRLVVRLPDGRPPRDVAERGQAALDARLGELCDEVFGAPDGAGRPGRGGRIDDTLPGGPYLVAGSARAQVAAMVDYQWAAAEEPPAAAGGYATALAAAEELLSARWYTQLWEATVPWAAPVPKSSLDGQRESVLREELFAGIGQRWTAEEVRQRYGAGPQERLCGVGLVKRLGRRESSRQGHHFLSTGHLAAWPLLERLEGLDAASARDFRGAWRTLLRHIEESGVVLRDLEAHGKEGTPHSLLGRFDGGLLFEGRLSEILAAVADPGARRERLRQARVALARALRATGVSTPIPYFAVLVADGDRMGRLIRAQTDHRQHRALSAVLGAFARHAREIVESGHRGELIYAGGDDVLAFVPLHRVVACARALAADFAARLHPFAPLPQPAAAQPPAAPPAAGEAPSSTPTLSAGVAVAHFLEPLGATLALARRAERSAKRTGNALSLIVSKRAGADIEVCGPWGGLDTDLDDFATLHRLDAVPDGAAFELQELSRLLHGVAEGVTGGAADGAALASLVAREAERILRRKQPQHGRRAELAAPVLDRLARAMQQLGVAELARRLIVARLLAQAGEEARPDAAPAPDGDPVLAPAGASAPPSASGPGVPAAAVARTPAGDAHG